MPERNPKETKQDERSSLNCIFERSGNSFYKSIAHSKWHDVRYSDDPEARYFHYHPRPLYIALPLLTVGVMLFIFQAFIPYGRLLIGENDFTGYLRMAMMIAGAYCIFLAWPRWRDSRMSDQEEEEVEALRERMWRRRFRP